MINSFSGSCHSSDGMWQEIGRTCGSAYGCPRPGSRIVVPRCQIFDTSQSLVLDSTDRHVEDVLYYFSYFITNRFILLVNSAITCFHISSPQSIFPGD